IIKDNKERCHKKKRRNLLQVKSGHASVKDIRELRDVLSRKKAAIGLFLTLEHPAKGQPSYKFTILILCSLALRLQQLILILCLD
ncbi:MAG: hypothetical protein WBZ20_01255, partial [Nitrososphaeraceae archaeon]